MSVSQDFQSSSGDGPLADTQNVKSNSVVPGDSKTPTQQSYFPLNNKNEVDITIVDLNTEIAEEPWWDRQACCWCDNGEWTLAILGIIIALGIGLGLGLGVGLTAGQNFGAASFINPVTNPNFTDIYYIKGTNDTKPLLVDSQSVTLQMPQLWQSRSELSSTGVYKFTFILQVNQPVLDLALFNPTFSLIDKNKKTILDVTFVNNNQLTLKAEQYQATYTLNKGKKWSDYLKPNSWQKEVPNANLASVSIQKLRNNEGFQVIMNNGDVIRTWTKDINGVANLKETLKMESYNWNGWESFPNYFNLTTASVSATNLGTKDAGILGIQQIKFETFSNGTNFNNYYNF